MRYTVNLKDSLLNRINELLEKELDEAPHADAAEVHLAVINMFETLYGPHAPQLDMIKTVRDQVYDRETWGIHYQPTLFIEYLHGFLRTLASDIQEGRVVNIQSEARGEVLGDFLVLAREALDEGQKDIAAVLACAALEDALKRYASDLGLEVQDKTMQTVVNALKSKGVINSSHGKVLDANVQIRNDALHARWDAINVEAVHGVIGYTQGFLTKRSASPIPADDPADCPAEAQE